MDIIERQNETYRRRERKVVKWLFAACMAMLVSVLVGTSIPAQADDGYQYGINVFSCATTKDQEGKYDCRVNGAKTERFKRLPFVSTTTGIRTMEVVHAYLPVYCDDYGCSSMVAMDGFPAGTIMGRGAAGVYIVESDWYLDYDTQGNTVAYRMDVGPQKGQALYGAAKPRPAHYGEEACYDAVIEQIRKNDPDVALPFDAIKERRSECGLTTEE